MEKERKIIRVKITEHDGSISRKEDIKPCIPYSETREQVMADCDITIHSLLIDPVANEYIIDLTARYD